MNKYQESADRLANKYHLDGVKDWGNILELVWKEIPMKPIPDLFGYICKSCDNDIYVGSSTINNYCDVCGQKLDWSEK